LYHAYQLLDAAAVCYHNASHLTPESFAWRYALADVLRQQGKITEAIPTYEQACRLQPANVACLTNLGKVYLDNNEATKAQEVLTRAVTLNPKAAAAHDGLGQVASAQGRFQDAIRHFEIALTLVPAASRLHYPLALAYQRLNNPEKAAFHMERRGTVGVKVADSFTEQLEGLIRGERVALVRGRLAFQAGQYADAAAEFKKALEAEPQSVTARVNLATTLVQIGDGTAAVAQLQEALWLQPNHGGAHYNLAVLLAQHQRLPEAIRHFRAALVADPNDLQAHRQVADALHQLGQDEEALMHYMKVTDGNPQDELALRWTAELLARLGNFAVARQRLEDAHQKFPDRGRTAHALARLLATCPDPMLRDGKRALELAQRVFAADHAAQHAETVALALAEVGQCEEASKWQHALVTAAEKEGNVELTQRFKTDLARYEHGSPCRPPLAINK
jgi:tetratricopeptide (TPR) repeat protein